MKYLFPTIALLFLMPRCATGEYIFELVDIPDVPFSTSPQNIQLDVWFHSTNPSGDGTPWLVGFQAHINAPSGWTWTNDADSHAWDESGGAHPYVMGTDQNWSAGIVPPFQGGGMAFSDTADSGDEFVLNDDDGVGTIEFTIPASEPEGVYNFTVNLSYGRTWWDEISDPSADPPESPTRHTPTSFLGGQIVIVPEPSSLIMLLGSLVGVGLVFFIRNRATRQKS